MIGYEVLIDRLNGTVSLSIELRNYFYDSPWHALAEISFKNRSIGLVGLTYSFLLIEIGVILPQSGRGFKNSRALFVHCTIAILLGRYDSSTITKMSCKVAVPAPEYQSHAHTETTEVKMTTKVMHTLRPPRSNDWCMSYVT